MNDFNEEKAVAHIAEMLAVEYGKDPETARKIRTAAALHDIGKLKIPQNILNKPGRLTDEEMLMIKTHTTLGADMLESIQGELGVIARTICLYHHEKYDGTGYWGKFTNQLPIYVPITSIADIFTALLFARPYKPPWTKEQALAYIKEQSGACFDPLLVEVFLPLAHENSRMSALFRREG